LISGTGAPISLAEVAVTLAVTQIVSYAMLNTKSKRVQVKLDTHAREQKEMLALAVFQEDAKSVASWRRSRHSIRSLQRTRRRIRVQSLDSNDPVRGVETYRTCNPCLRLPLLQLRNA
jgi:hypothetical protein